jgi:hypothetical protein
MLNNAHIKFTFSGHESFQCRQLWLKKGYDFLRKQNSFRQEDAVVKLGVGKNMVASIRFWMRAFDLIDDNDKPTSFAENLFDTWDPYLEDEASLWLLHYHLLKKELASTYSLVFKILRKEKVEFNKENFLALVKREAETNNLNINPKTVVDDFEVFLKMYVRSEAQGKDKEDAFSGLLTELDLVRKKGTGQNTYYYIENTERTEIPAAVIMYAIVDQYSGSTSLPFSTFEPLISTAFSITRAGLLNKITEFANDKVNKKMIVYREQAGIRELQIKDETKPSQILKNYYNAD